MGEELETTIKSALRVLRHALSNPVCFPGGGCTEALLASRLRKEHPHHQTVADLAECLESIAGAITRPLAPFEGISTLCEVNEQYNKGGEFRGWSSELFSIVSTAIDDDDDGRGHAYPLVLDCGTVKQRAFISAIDVASIVLQVGCTIEE